MIDANHFLMETRRHASFAEGKGITLDRLIKENAFAEEVARAAASSKDKSLAEAGQKVLSALKAAGVTLGKQPAAAKTDDGVDVWAAAADAARAESGPVGGMLLSKWHKENPDKTLSDAVNALSSKLGPGFVKSCQALLKG